MFITKVKGNVKAGVDVEIGQKTLFVGPNGSGKSSVCNAIELALTGRAGDIAGRTDIAREADVMSLAKDGARDLEALVTFDDGVVAAYRTSGSTAKAKKATGDRPTDRCHEDVLPIRTLKEALLGSPQTARKFLLSKVGGTVTHADVEALIPEPLRGHFVECMPANLPVADGLVAAIEYAAKQARDASTEAKTAREAAKLVSGGRGAPPTDTEIAAAVKAAKDARAALTEAEGAAGRAANLATAEAELQMVEAQADKAAIDLTNARTALNDSKPPKGFAPVVHVLPQVIDESCAVGECLCCGGGAPQSAMAVEIRAALADYDKQKAAHDKLVAATVAAEAFAKAALEILDKTEQKVAELKSKSDGMEVDPAFAQKAVEETERAVVELKTAKNAWLKVQQAESAALDADRRAVEWKALKEACENAMALTVDRSLSSFVSKVQACLPPGDTFDLRLRDGDREVVQFGLVRDGQLHTALSGAEWARVTAAMAEACLGDQKFAVLIPEERAFDPLTLTNVMKALGSTKHQVVLTSPVAPKTVPAGWVVVKRGAV